MLPPAQSPLHTLVFPWWHGRRVGVREVASLRLALTAAMLAEIPLHAADYDVFTDHRLLWAIQYLQHAAGDIPHINPNLAAAAAWVFDPPLALDRISRAAGAA